LWLEIFGFDKTKTEEIGQELKEERTIQHNRYYPLSIVNYQSIKSFV